MALSGPLKTGIARFWRLGQRLSGRRGLTILYYHAVPDDSAASFRAQMVCLAAEAELVFADHDQPLQGARPQVAVTFDDAFASVARNALPVLQELRIPATIFVPTGWMGQAPGWAMETGHDRGEQVMTAAALAACQSPLVRLGSHSVSHPRMATLSAEAQTEELRQSRAALEGIATVGPVDGFAFPYGSLNADALNEAAAAGYRHAYSVLPQRIDPTDGGLLRGRSAVEPDDPLPLFRLKLHGAFAWMPLAIRAKRWLRGSGQ